MILFFFLILLAFPGIVWASLDEVNIFTPDKQCALHYLSRYPKSNWYIQLDPKMCHDGWVDGVGEIELYSATKEKKEILRGFFREGYWVDSLVPIGSVIERNSPSEGVQRLSFLLGEDPEANITYIGQLRSVQPAGRSYGPFQACPDFRVLVVVSDVSLFQREAFLDKIVDQGVSYAHSLCASPSIVALFGATSRVDPTIVFQMQVDPVTKNRKIIPLTFPLDSDSECLLELRPEKADVLLSVTSEKEKVHVSYQAPKGRLSMPMIASKKKKDILTHVHILSRALNKPILGRFVVHIQNILLDGTGMTDLPQKVRLLYYPGLRTGWAVVEGKLQNFDMQVSSVQFCEQEWCSDVP